MYLPNFLRGISSSYLLAVQLLSVGVLLITGLSIALSGISLFFLITVIGIIFLLISLYLLIKQEYNTSIKLYSYTIFSFYASIALLVPVKQSIWIVVYPILINFIADFETGIILSLAILALSIGRLAFSYVNYDSIPHIIFYSKIITIYLFVLLIGLLKNHKVSAYIKYLEGLLLFDLDTGAYSKLYLENEIEKAIYLLKRYDIPFAFIGINIEGLMNIDPEKVPVILSKFVENLKKMIRKTDIIARYDENIFVIQLINSSKASAEKVVDRIEVVINEFKRMYNLKFRINIEELEKDDDIDAILAKLLRW